MGGSIEPCIADKADAVLGDMADWRDMPPGWRTLGTELCALCWCCAWAPVVAGGCSNLICGA